MTNLTIGQRIDVYEVREYISFNPIPSKRYALKKGEQRISSFTDTEGYVLLFMKDCKTFYFPPDEVKKIGTFIVKSLKGGSNA